MRRKLLDNANWLSVFVTIIVFFSAIAVSHLWIKIDSLEDQLANKITAIEEELSSKEETLQYKNEYMDYYRDINTKMDQAIDRLITIAEITITTMLVFGFLLAYKAPRDVERELERLRSETNNAKESAEEARYQALICMAESRESAHDRILQYDEIVAKYPSRPDAYNARGNTYDDLGEYDRAIRDYETAHSCGGEERVYLNNVAVAHSKAGHHALAQRFYTRAIDLNPNDAPLYSNRAIARSEEGDFHAALTDLDVALSLDPRNPSFFVNRAAVYRDMLKSAQKDADRKKYTRCVVEDLAKARELEPNNKLTSNLLDDAIQIMQRTSPNEDAPFQAMQAIASLEKVLAEKALSQGGDGFEDALRHLSVSVNAAAIAQFGNDASVDSEDIQVWFKQEISINMAVDLITKHEAVLENTELKLGDILAAALSSVAYNTYLEGQTLSAERLFALLAHSENISADNSLTNLAYMRRRGETSETIEEAINLLDRCKESRTGVWTMNVALCYVDGIGVEKNYARFIQLIEGDTRGAKESYDWWRNVNLVGPKESNIALLGLALAGFNNLGDDVTIGERMSIAKGDGYDIGPALKPVGDHYAANASLPGDSIGESASIGGEALTDKDARA